ncbi:unnamed protein product [Penicillium glandicola]
MEPKPTIKFKLNGVSTSEADVDNLELQACYRALDNLRNLLFQAPMLDLLKDQIEEGNRYFESLIRASRGEFREYGTSFYIPDTPRELCLGQIVGWSSLGTIWRNFDLWMQKQREEEYEMVEYLVAKLDGGSKFFYIMNEFMDTGGGCKIKLRAFFPSASPWPLINQHAEHLAVEFRNLLQMVHGAIEELEDSY